MNSHLINDLEQLDRSHMVHPVTPLADFAAGTAPSRIVTGGEGVYIVDREGKRSLDAFAGLYCVNVGYGRPEIKKAVEEQFDKLAYFHVYGGHSNEAIILLSERIIRLFGRNMSRVFYGLSGSDANETAVKLVWYYNNILGRAEKKKIISRQRAYHGSAVMSGSLTGLPLFHNAFDLPLAQVRHTSCPHYWKYGLAGESEAEFSRRCARELDSLIEAEGPETVAAFIGEPVMGTGGIIPPPQGYWEEIRKVLEKHDVLLIADEVITGYGRTGEMFGSHTYGMQPDLVTMAKGLTSAYLPLSAVMIRDTFWEVLEQGTSQYGVLGHGWTYSAHPLCAAAANANLDIIESENLVANANIMGAYFLKRLHEAFADHEIVGEVRGVGLLAAIEFATGPDRKAPFRPEQKVGARIAAELLEEGVIGRAMPHGDGLGFSPPLVINRSEIDQIVDASRKAVNRIAGQLKQERG